MTPSNCEFKLDLEAMQPPKSDRKGTLCERHALLNTQTKLLKDATQLAIIHRAEEIDVLERKERSKRI
jgi:hypothetical protein